MLRLLLGLVSTAAYSLLPDTDYFGGDLIPVKNINETMKCLSICEKIEECRLATWCQMDSTCYVKNNKTKPSYKQGCYTIDMYPNIITTTQAVIQTPEPTEQDEATPVATTNKPKSDSGNSAISLTVLVFSTLAAMC